MLKNNGDSVNRPSPKYCFVLFPYKFSRLTYNFKDNFSRAFISSYVKSEKRRS